MDSKTRKFAIKSREDIINRGITAFYSILLNGKDCYSNRTEADFINDGFIVIFESEFDELIKENENSLCGHWVEISEELFSDRLNILPPMRYYNGGFYICEAYTGNIHDFCQELNGKYYTSLQRTSTPRNEIISELIAAIASGNVGKEI